MIETRVREVVRETADATTLRLEAAGAPAYRAGQSIAIDPAQFAGLKGAPRHFSLASHPLEDGLAITVKVGPHAPLVEHLAREVKVGDAIEVDGPFGRCTLPDRFDGVAGLLFVAAGSGITPHRSMIGYALAAKLPVTLSLVDQNRTEADVIYRRELDALAGRVRIVHLLSSKGRYIKVEDLKAACGDPAATLAYVCGPNRKGDRPPFVDAMVAHLHSLGVRVRREG